MTIRDIVLIPFKTSISQQEITRAMAAFEELKNVIPQIQSFTWGANNSPENLHQGYLHGYCFALSGLLYFK